jgi:hypothetical protein
MHLSTSRQEWIYGVRDAMKVNRDVGMSEVKLPIIVPLELSSRKLVGESWSVPPNLVRR